MASFNEVVSGAVLGAGLFTGLAAPSPIEESFNQQNDSSNSSLEEKAKNIYPSLIAGATEDDQFQSSVAASEEEKIRKRDEEIDIASISDNQATTSAPPDPDGKAFQLKGDYGQKLENTCPGDDDWENLQIQDNQRFTRM
jgi:hypothetical protein